MENKVIEEEETPFNPKYKDSDLFGREKTPQTGTNAMNSGRKLSMFNPSVLNKTKKKQFKKKAKAMPKFEEDIGSQYFKSLKYDSES